MLNELLMRYPALGKCKDEIENALRLISDTYKNGGKVLVCGNGSSGYQQTSQIGGISAQAS